MGHVELRKPAVEVFGKGDGDDVVGDAVQDERGREMGGGTGQVGFDEAAGDVDEGAKAGALDGIR